MHHQVGCLLATNLRGADSFQSSVWGFFNSVPMFILLCALEKMLGTDGLNMHFGQPASLLRGVVVVSYLRTCDSVFLSSFFAYLSLHSALACAVCIGFFFSSLPLVSFLLRPSGLVLLFCCFPIPTGASEGRAIRHGGVGGAIDRAS